MTMEFHPRADGTFLAISPLFPEGLRCSYEDDGTGRGVFRFLEGPAIGKAYHMDHDRDAADTAILEATVKDSKGYQKFRAALKSICQAKGVSPPADEELGGGNPGTQIDGLRTVTAALNEAGHSDHVFDVAAAWNASPEAADAAEPKGPAK